MRVALRMLAVFALITMGVLLFQTPAHALLTQPQDNISVGDQDTSPSEQNDMCATGDDSDDANTNTGTNGSTHTDQWKKKCGNITSTDTFHAFRCDPGSHQQLVDVWGGCRYIENHDRFSHFIPFRSQFEWWSFINGAHPGLFLRTCVRPVQVIVTPGEQCNNPQPINLPPYCHAIDPWHVACALPYAPTDFTHSEVIRVGFSCSFPDNNCSGGNEGWSEMATARFQAGCQEGPEAWKQVGETFYTIYDPNGYHTGGSCTAGQCGQANGIGAICAPPGGLCAPGSTASRVTGRGPWNWTCTGDHGGTTVQCDAPVRSVINGVCGSSDGVASASAPATNLCNSGTATAVGGNGPWNWACAGQLGGSTAYCHAPVKTDGECGSANGTATDHAPQPNGTLCAHGTASNVTGYGPWNWTCSSDQGGATAQCSAPVKPTNGQCGSANGTPTDHAPVPNGTLCVSGEASDVTGQGPWNWTCSGANGGTAANCDAPLLSINGQCGSANGVSTDHAPNCHLCDSGNASQVAGNGPWNWTCSGAYGGNTVWCSAPITPVNGECGNANGQQFSSAPTSGLCNYGVASDVNGDGPWNWACTGQNGGTSATCSATTTSTGSACWTGLNTPGFSCPTDQCFVQLDSTGDYATPIGHTTGHSSVIVGAGSGNILQLFNAAGASHDGEMRNLIIGPGTTVSITGAGATLNSITGPAVYHSNTATDWYGVFSGYFLNTGLTNQSVFFPHIMSSPGHSGMNPWLGGDGDNDNYHQGATLTVTCGGQTSNPPPGPVCTNGGYEAMIFGMYTYNWDTTCAYALAGTTGNGPTNQAGSVLARFWNLPNCSNPVTDGCVTKRTITDARRIGCGGDQCMYCAVYIKSCQPIGGGGRTENLHIQYY